jgi:nicotinamide-nucleotide amidase
MLPMLDALIAERIRPRFGSAGLVRRVVKTTDVRESDVDARARPVYERWRTAPVPIATSILATQGQIELHLTAPARRQNEGEAALAAAVRELETVLGDVIFSTDGRALEAVVGDLLRERGMKVAVAESCSGGLLSSRLTDVPGSSAYFDFGAVCYSNEAKTEWLGVPAALIQANGAVSEPVARAMAEGIRARAGVSVGIGVTGIAGPGGGTEQKPVGTVAIAVVTPQAARVRTFQFPGERHLVKSQSAQAAMNILRLMLLDSAKGDPALD